MLLQLNDSVAEMRSGLFDAVKSLNETAANTTVSLYLDSSYIPLEFAHNALNLIEPIMAVDR